MRHDWRALVMKADVEKVPDACVKAIRYIFEKVHGKLNNSGESQRAFN
jgi:hypothetical protein